MREIKFRAWNKKLKKITDLRGSGEFTDFNEIFNDPALEFMQYTGLKDKNGKEIYEGDIIFWEGMPKMGAVEYKDSHFYIKPNWTLSGVFQNDYEVIGNIYENPELIV